MRKGTLGALTLTHLFVTGCLLATGAPQSDYKRGLEAYSKDDLLSAEKYLKQATQADKRLFAARFLLGATLVRMNRPDEAIPELEAAHEIQPGHADVVKLLAIQYRAAGRIADSLRLLAASPRSARDQELYLLLIEANQDVGSVDRATQLVREAVQRYPDSARLNAWMGFEMREAGRFDAAIPYLRKAQRREPELAAPHFLMGDVLLKQEKYRESMAWFRKTIELLPHDIEAVIGLSRALTGLGDLRGALTQLEGQSRLGSADPRLALEMARLYARLGDSQNARKQADLAVALRRTQTSVPDSLRYGSPK